MPKIGQVQIPGGDGLFYPISPYTYKNKLVNPAFQFWQVGTSTATTGYLADQWNSTFVAGTVTISRITNPMVGSQYALQWVTGAASSNMFIYQPLEQAEVIPLRSKTVTFSVYAQATSGFTGQIVIGANYSNSSDALASQTVAISQVGYNLTTSMTRYTWTFTVPADAVGMEVGIWTTSVQPTGVTVVYAMAQLEIGSYATSFETIPYELELKRCQRFLSYVSVHMRGQVTAATQYIDATIFWPAIMRVAPTVNLISVSNSGLVSVEGRDYITADGMRYELTSTAAGSMFLINRVLQADARL